MVKIGDTVRLKNKDSYGSGPRSWGSKNMVVTEPTSYGYYRCKHPDLGVGAFRASELEVITAKFKVGDFAQLADITKSLPWYSEWNGKILITSVTNTTNHPITGILVDENGNKTGYPGSFKEEQLDPWNDDDSWKDEVSKFRIMASVSPSNSMYTPWESFSNQTFDTYRKAEKFINNASGQAKNKFVEIHILEVVGTVKKVVKEEKQINIIRKEVWE